MGKWRDPLIFEDLYFNWEDAFTGFDGGSVTVVENPDPDDVNSTSRVGSMVKDGGEYWGGAWFEVERPFSFSDDHDEITMKVWSPREDVQVLMKVEQQNGTLFYEIAEPTTTSGKWEEMTWDMSGAGFENQWDIITLIFDFTQGQVGDGSEDFTWYFDDLHVFALDAPTSTEEKGAEIPVKHVLHQNYPKPFNPITVIMFELPQLTDIRLDVFNVMGQRVATLADGIHQAGRHAVEFEASRLSSGVYVYRTEADGFSIKRKMTLIQ